jgi:hypothetical protein
VGAAEGHEGEDSYEETAEGRKAGADDGDVDLDNGPNGKLELDVTLVGRIPVVANKTCETDGTDNGRAACASLERRIRGHATGS